MPEVYGLLYPATTVFISCRCLASLRRGRGGTPETLVKPIPVMNDDVRGALRSARYGAWRAGVLDQSAMGANGEQAKAGECGRERTARAAHALYASLAAYCAIALAPAAAQGMNAFHDLLV